MEIQTFIIANTQDQIIERGALLNQLENPVWLLTTPNPATDRIGFLDNVIVVSQLPTHCEKDGDYSRSMLNYTAYHAIVNNNLVNPKTDYVRVVEYDSDFPQGVQTYKATTLVKLKSKLSVYCHKEHSMSNCWYKPQHLIELCEKGLAELFSLSLRDLSRRSRNNMFMETTNFVFTPDFLSKFMNYADKFEPYFAYQAQGGNNLERLFTIFCLQHGYKWGVINGLHNQYRNSHGTS